MTHFDFIKPKRRAKKIFGLTYRPTAEPERSDDEDHVPWIRDFAIGNAFSKFNAEVLLDQIKSLGTDLNCIVEVGVSKFPGPEKQYREKEKANKKLKKAYSQSSTQLLISKKPKNCVYLGIDIEDKKYIEDPENKVFIIQCDSGQTRDIMDRLATLGHKSIDLLMIDGWHSINAVVQDWKLAEFISDHGLVVMHDTNAHTGPVAVFDAIDESLFVKKKMCDITDENGNYRDWGIAVIKKR